MSSVLLSTAILVHMGALLYAIGFMVRDELWLRLLVLGGTALYIMYYLFHPATPLWDAIITSLVLGAANVWVLCIIILERTTFAMTDEQKSLYEAFGTLNPGQFRKLEKHAVWHDAIGGETLCTENEQADRLYYLFEGQAQVIKDKKKFNVPERKFLGEISFILGGNYSATVKAKKGMRYVEWRNEDIHSQMKKSPALHNAVIALFNKDLASKLAVSFQ